MIEYVLLTSRTATICFKTLHIISGQAPANPRIGFLPPNSENGTDGQGFIAYSIKPLKNASSRSVIDAMASIIFDQNKPINTPPIFNTVSLNIKQCSSIILAQLK